jgi:hypothetical protein
MMDAAMTSVDANLSCFCRSAFSLAMVRRISPISAPSFLISPVSGSVDTTACLERCLWADSIDVHRTADMSQ